MMTVPFGTDVKVTLIPKIGDDIVPKETIKHLKVSIVRGNSKKGFTPIYKVGDAGIDIEIQRHHIKYPGVYKIILDWRRPDAAYYDGYQDISNSCSLINFSTSCKVMSDNTADIEISPVYKGDKGDKGDSAYQVWLDAGNIGTEEDYFNWLQKPATDIAETVNLQEQARVDAESLRTTAESSRELAESLRVDSEIVREQQEQDRQTNTATAITNVETATVQATTAAEQADTARLAIEGELALKAAHGYASNPKTLKEVDDSKVDKLDDVEQVRSQATNKVPSSKLFDDELGQISSDLGEAIYEIEQKQIEIDVINDALNNEVTQLGSYSYNHIGQFNIQTLSPKIPTGRIYFVIQSENQQTVFLNNLQFRQQATATAGDTNLTNLTCVCGKRYYVDTTNNSARIVIKSPSVLTIELLDIQELQDFEKVNVKTIKNLSLSSVAISGSVESDDNIGFPISGNIIDGIHIENSNWRHTDFIKITELGHNIYSTLYNVNTNIVFFYSSNSEDSYIGAISGINFETNRENFINHKAFVSIFNCIPNAKYFRAVSYKDDTYADGLRLGVYALSQKELEPYINKLNNSKFNFDKRINYVGHSIWWYDGRALSPSTTGTGGGEIAIGYQSLLEMVFGFAAKGNYCYSSNSLGGTSANDTASIMNHSDEWEGTSDDIWTLDCATNDFKRNIPLGTINNYTNKTGITTFYGALREYNDKVNSLSNNATVICSNAIARNNDGYTSTSVNTVNCKLSDYGNAIKEIARLNGWIFIDQFNSCGITDDNVFNYTIDGLHLNNAGYLIAVMPWIETLMEVYQNLYIKAKELLISESVGTDLLQVVDKNNRRVAAINKNGELFTNIIDLGLYLEEGDLNDYEKVINNTLIIANLFEEYDGTGKTLYLPNGTWSIATGITIRSGINFVGASRSAILKVKHSLTHSLGAVFGYDGTSVDNPIQNAEFRNFTIDMSDYILNEYESWNVNQKGIFCQYMNNCTIDNVCIIGSPATAIGVDYLVNCRVTNNTLINCGKYWANKTKIHEGVGGCAGIGIGTGGYTDENLVITNNECINCGQFGIFIENQGEAFGGQNNKPANGIIISNNIVRETRRHGIGVRGARSVVVSGNEVYGNYGSGIFLELICKDVLINGNNISKNGLVDDSEALDFLIDPQRYGIAFHSNTDADNVVISGNSIYQNKNGLYTKGSNLNAVVIKNNNSDNAVKIESGTTVSSVVGNIFRGDFYIYGNHTSLCFKDNVIYGETQKIDMIFDGDNRFNDIY